MAVIADHETPAATPRTAPTDRRPGVGATPAILVAATLALLAIALANNSARSGPGGWSSVVFWIGLLAIVVPATIRLLQSITRTERLCLITGTTVVLYLVKVVYEPAQFALHDELGQYRTTSQIMQSGHLFQANPVVRAYPYFPGMNVATAVIARVTHLSIFDSGVVLIGVARLVGVLALFFLLERITKSDRLAAIGVLVYFGNPNFLYFDAQYGYESLALSLGLVVLLAVSLADRTDAARAWSARILASLLTVAVVVTHHVAAYWLVAVLVLWSGVLELRRRRWPTLAADVGVPAIPAAIGLVTVLIWQLGVAQGATTAEVDPIANGSRALFRTLFGTSSSGKTLFQSNTGQGGDPLWAQLIGFAAVALALLALLFGWWLIRSRRGLHPVGLIFVAATILFPFTLALRLTQSGTETSNRASEYLYIGVGLLAALVSVSIQQRMVAGGPTEVRHRYMAGPNRGPTAFIGLVSLYIAILFVGGLIVGWAPYERQPGPYLAAAETRSVDPLSVQAAHWAAANLRPGAFIATDSVNGSLMSAYAKLNPQTGVIDGRPVTALFYSTTFGADQQQIIQADKIAYIVADRRITTAPPQASGYFIGPVPAGINAARPLPAAALAKFDHALGFTKVYDSGTIAIYATGLS